MTYLDAPRLTFSGAFQADVSTVNNDVRHYDNEAFQPAYQQLQTSDALNGWWNPEGTGAFRLVDLRIRSATTVDGASDDDPALGLYVNGQDERSAAKLVDLDPQWQMASEIWGLRIYLTDGSAEYLRGTFLPAAFRDIYFGRLAGASGSGSASARFASVLTEVEFLPAASSSKVLRELEQSARDNGDRLSVSLTTFGYQGGRGDGRFTFGTLIGAIGPWSQGSPETFVLGRRFAPADGNASARGIGYFDASVSHDRAQVSVDLGNALPLRSADGELADIGSLELVVLRAPDTEAPGPPPTVGAGTPQDQTVTGADFESIGSIDYRAESWLLETAGIVSLDVPAEAAALLEDHPLALIRDSGGSQTVEIRETIGGYLTRADDFVRRIDAPSSGASRETISFFASQYGRPIGGAQLGVAKFPPQAGNGLPPLDPPVDMPQTGTPTEAVTLVSLPATDAAGSTRLAFDVSDPANPRGYIDGQIYFVRYGLQIQGLSRSHGLDRVILHVRDAFEAPTDPDWETDVAPVLTQFGNLYPIMSKRLFSFSDEETVKRRAQILHFALSRPMDDPTHMPVTRDLSAGKRQMLLDWLSGVLGVEAPSLEAASLTAAEAQREPLEAGEVPGHTESAPSAEGTAAIEAALGGDYDGKTAAMRGVLREGSSD